MVNAKMGWGSRGLTAACLLLAAGVSAVGAEWSWQQPYATVMPNGDLQWAPQPFVYTPGASIRYIDFAGGNDSNDGLSPDQPWQHHPWDPNATSNAAACTTIQTYVFKRGVIYRGTLRATASGAPGNPIRLTSDPAWGAGDAMLYGSERVTGWKKGGHAKMPESARVWHAEVPFAPRLVGVVRANGKITRLTLARTPNWTVTDPDNTLANCWSWENPQWWVNSENYKTIVNGKKMLMGVDTQHLTNAPDYYEGALIWSEWGIVMGSPYATPVEAFDPKKKSIAFQGPWYNWNDNLATGHRYWLEDKPHYLDESGEFWFDKQGDGGTLYVRLPGDADPSTLTVEAARHTTIIDAKNASHLDISGLTFRFGNICWNLDYMGWQGDVDTAAIRIIGSGKDVAVRNCRFDFLPKAIHIDSGDQGRLDDVHVTDNDISHVDHGSISIYNGVGGDNPQRRDWPGYVGRVDVLRNRMRDVGFRAMRPRGNTTLEVLYPERAEIAGNVLERCGGAGIMALGGKCDGAAFDVPFSRILVHHNKVTNPLLMINDYGGIECNMGGPFYIYSNVSGNPVGRMNWGRGTFGHAYYVDGGFKAYLFNNIAWGACNATADLTSANCSAFQEIISYQNTFFNNTAYRFLVGSRRQAPQAGRDKFLGNIFEDISTMVFRHSDAEGKDPNARDAGKQLEHFDYQYNAYSRNALADIRGKVAVFEAEGGDYPDIASFAKALAARKAMASDVGVMSPTSLVRNAAQHDFRPASGSAALGKGVKVFVPWSLYATVGEWNFTMDQADPAEIVDEHWYQKAHMENREKYFLSPMYPLHAVNVTAANYENGPLEDWAKGALRLNGKDQYLVLTNIPPAAPAAPREVKMRTVTGTWFTATMPPACTPGVPFEMNVTLLDIPADAMLASDLNCAKGSAFGGYLATVGRQAIDGAGPYTFTIDPPAVAGITAYIFTLYAGPGGNWDTAVHRDSISVEPRADRNTPALFNPQIDRSSFLVEAYFKTESGAQGVLAEKMAAAGWSVSINSNGLAEVSLRSTDARHAISSSRRVNDGQWHHLIVEADRTNRTMTIYVDGTRDASGAGVGNVSLANDADLHVGGTPTGRGLACVLDFLRISHGTLADAHTTIEELYAWQFDGPFLRDFRGVRPKGKRAAGALHGE